jgi:AsmA protein
LPKLGADADGWNRAAFNTRSVADDDIDLRVSASRARMGNVELDDGSLSVQSGHGRMELSLGEARAYDGLLKGRLVATLRGGMTEVRADATVSRLDLMSLLKDVEGSERLHGIATGHVTLEGSGSSPAELIHSLTGHGQVSVRNGEIDAALLDEIVKPAPSAGRWPLARLPNNIASFDSASMSFAIDQGQLSLADSQILWPSVRALVTGWASLPRRTADLRAIISPIGDDEGQPGVASAAFGLSGSWSNLRLKPERSGF